MMLITFYRIRIRAAVAAAAAAAASTAIAFFYPRLLSVPKLLQLIASRIFFRTSKIHRSTQNNARAPLFWDRIQISLKVVSAAPLVEEEEEEEEHSSSLCHLVAAAHSP